MSWAEIGKAINDTFSKKGRKRALNRIVEDEAYNSFYNFMATISYMQYQGSVFDTDVWKVVPYGVEELTSDHIGTDLFDSVVLPNTVKIIKNHTFPSHVRYVSLPPSLKTIESYAFIDCKDLANVVLPNRLETIGQYAFTNCKSLTVISIPESVKSIATNAFSGCNNLNDIYVSWSEAETSGAPWGAPNATVHYNSEVTT